MGKSLYMSAMLTLVLFFVVFPSFSAVGSEKAHDSTGIAEASEPMPAGGQASVSGLRVVWVADDCGCTPIQPKKVRGGVMTYGMFHKGLELETDEKTKTGIARIKFSRLNRIGYDALTYDLDKGFVNYDEWAGNTFVTVARQYNSRVDIVVALAENARAIFINMDENKDEKENAANALAGRIHRLIFNHGGDGVTIDLQGYSGLSVNGLVKFLKQLKAELETIDQDLFVNLMIGFDPDAKAGPFDGLSVEHAAALSAGADLFLVRLIPSKKEDASLKDLFLSLSRLIDRYGLENNNIEFKDKTLPVIPYMEGTADNEIFNQILTVGYGGVGLWPGKSLGEKETRFIMEVFSAHPSMRNLDVIKALLEKACPDCCKQICPSRRYLLFPTYVLGAALFLFYIFSFFFCELRVLARTHAKYVIAACLVFAGLILAIILCVPFWQGMRSLAVTLIFLGLAGYVLRELIRRRRQARFP